MRQLALCVIALVSLGSTGCAALVLGGAGAGVAGYAYSKAPTEHVIQHPLNQTWPATQQAVQAMNLPIEKRGIDSLGARIVTRTATGKEGIIELMPEGPATRVKVRIGTFGDETAQSMIISRIEMELNGIAQAGGIVPTPVPMQDNVSQFQARPVPMEEPPTTVPGILDGAPLSSEPTPMPLEGDSYLPLR